MAATLVRRVLEETLQIHTNGTSEYEHVQTVSESPLWWVGVLLDAVATLAGTGGKQLLRHAAVDGLVRAEVAPRRPAAGAGRARGLRRCVLCGSPRTNSTPDQWAQPLRQKDEDKN